ncbi:hypothetical protein BDN71DRAFT_776504 [Pleurotus eryngii]|uniref:Uncharacterized protein n=1 Tax=Pleurotus eryngii TaxID=5323 RepID=A0A9P6CZW2_PLEER|nr:hypothetical protein BDN71DRAFT_776504 [Pleurotus eryngii]
MADSRDHQALEITRNVRDISCLSLLSLETSHPRPLQLKACPRPETKQTLAFSVTSTTRCSRAAGRGRLAVPLLEVHRAEPMSLDPAMSILVDYMTARRTRAAVRALRTLLDDDGHDTPLARIGHIVRAWLSALYWSNRKDVEIVILRLHIPGSLPTRDRAWAFATTMQHLLYSPSCNNLGLVVSLRHLHQKGRSSPLFVVSNSHSPCRGGLAVSSPQSLAYLAAWDLAPSASRLGTYRGTSVNM